MSLISQEKKYVGVLGKMAVFLLLLLACFSIQRAVWAVPVEVAADVPATVNAEKERWYNTLLKSLQKAGSIAFQRTLSSALNKIAYDTANYLGSGGAGQKPLFITQSWGDYLTQIGDEAAGEFIESFVNNLGDTSYDCVSTLNNCYAACSNSANVMSGAYTSCIADCDSESVDCAAKNVSDTAAAMKNTTPSFNVCSPSSLEAKIKIGLGLVDQNRPVAPNCTASKMISNWKTDLTQKWQDLRDPNFLNTFTSIFNPRSNDLGISILARTDLSSEALIDRDTAKTELSAKKGWLDVRGISGMTDSAPGSAERELETAKNIQEANIGKITGDVFVDASSVFLNQLALSAFQTLLRSLAKEDNNNSSVAVSRYESDPNNNGGATALKEITTKLLKPNFGVRTDYNILSSLAICPDPNNPGPDNCVIDDKFMQGITEKRTVAEALDEGYLHGDWQITGDSQANGANRGDAYSNSYSLRNLSILRKYRILPLGWEQAAYLTVKNNKVATLSDLVSCFSKTDQYNTFSSSFSADHDWCEGLVDPNWVLKAPLNYCKKEGFGAQILNTNIIPSVSGASPVKSSLSISRADDYCADNQTCIKEKADGSCEAYGYCSEDKRTWVFNTDSCQPINNTCQSFTSSSNKKVSYLKNTLDYGDCNSDNSGCRQYSWFGAYATSTSVVSWNTNQSRYFNKNLNSCTSANDGCSALVRVKPTWGVNLVMNADFANDNIGDSSIGNQLNDWYISPDTIAYIVDVSTEPGGFIGKAIKLTADRQVGVYSSSDHSILPNNFQVFSGQSYTVSADVYLAAGANAGLTVGGTPYYQVITDKGSWQHLSITRASDNDYSKPEFAIYGNNSSQEDVVLYIRNIKFEVGDWDTGYSSYMLNAAGKSFKFYEKLLPAYLESSCYVNASGGTKDYNLKSDAPAICSNYARKCNREEVGCERYTATVDNFSVGAKVNSADYCAAECVGYDLYIAKASYFSSPYSENIIPAKSTVCSAAAAGCSEFTNLDALNQGGESKEYYTQLKQCIKPDTNSCASFYAWEGGASGYQLRSYNLKKDANGLPAVSVDDSALCNATIFNLPLSDPYYNADCREFYNASGQVAYHLVSRTITCSDNCHAYRLSEVNVDQSLSAAQCTGTSRHWDPANNVCNSCLNGGIWDDAVKACIYQAIPGEGQSCRASENSCREYNGSNGSNVKQLAAFDFENGLGDWHGTCNSVIKLSTVANSKNGHSLQYYNSTLCANAIGQDAEITRLPLIKQILANENTAAQLKVNGLVQSGSSYTVKFLARATAATDLSIYFFNPTTGARSDFSAVTIQAGNDWAIYQANLGTLDHEIGSKEILAISANNNFYLDNFILSEITDRYYLIKNSSQIPDSCYYDIFDKYQGPDYNLGCAEYSDRSNLKHNLHKFSQLCSDSAIGCEQMIDTKNYSPYQAGYWLDGVATSSCDTTNNPSCLKVEGDSMIYAVYDPKKLCSAASQGCSRLGEGQGGANFSGWVDVFKNNNPDQYNNILCAQSNLGCEAWTNSDDASAVYFKDPGTAVCVYRASTKAGVLGKRWFRAPFKRCDLDGSGTIESDEGVGLVCSSDNDCNGKKCLLDNNDYECDISYDKTIGFGGSGNQVPVPQDDAALCDASASTCGEYIDPVTNFAPNLVMNPSYQLVDGIYEGWGASSKEKWNNSSLTADQQVIRLTPYKLYSVTISGLTSGTVNLSFLNNIGQLTNNNLFSTNITSFAITNANANKPFIFNARNNGTMLITGGGSGRTIVVKELSVNYQLANNIDKSSCQGQTKLDNGCILFNERVVNGASGLAVLNYDAYATPDGTTPKLCNATNSCNANQLIKVRPDRVCAKWLDCTTYTQDPVTKKKTCYSFAQCDRLDDKGECANFLSDGSLATTDPKNNPNASGYTLTNAYNLNQMSLVGRDLNISFDFEDDSDSGNQISCGYDGAHDGNCVIDNPEAAAKAVDYPAHGAGYLKLKIGDAAIDLSASNPVKTGNSDEFYLSYLLNTTQANGAKALITVSGSGVTSSQFGAEADSGWERKIQKFSLGTAGQKSNITINLSATSSVSNLNGSIYFDDISVEPVLKIAEDQYAVPECRLYPGASSLTCFNKNKNVVSDGLEGYCLEHDPVNKNVCLLWYPLDNVPTLSWSSSGYSGNFPTSYCTQASGNFDLLEYRRAYHAAYIQVPPTVKGDVINMSSGPLYSLGYGCYPFDGITYAKVESINGVTCPSNYNLWLSYTDGGMGHTHIMCVPDRNSLILPTTVNHLAAFPYAYGNVVSDLNWSACQNINYLIGYGIYNGFQGAEGYNYPELNNPTEPLLKVWDHDSSPNPTENDLKLIPRLAGNPGGTTEDDFFHIHCQRFVQTVDAGGDNAAWVGRVSSGSQFSLTTTNYPLLKSPYSQDLFVAPFGSANIPSGTNISGSPLISVYDASYSGVGSGLYAGRPYGCANGATTSGCKYIGYCDDDPNVYCLATSSDDKYLSKRNCSIGTCQPLFNTNYLNTSVVDVLKNIFLKSTAIFNFNNVSKVYVAADNTSAGYNFMGGSDTPIDICSDGTRAAGEYCAILPKISNWFIYYGNNTASPESSATSINIKQKGIYRLEFNTTVDAEQQPLRTLEINWGDGYIQTVTGQDDKPTVEEPHIFYHYYAQTGVKNISVKITDNWGFYRESSDAIINTQYQQQQ